MTPTAPPEANAVATPELLRRVRRLEIRARRFVASRLLGQYHSVFRGRGLEFSEVRAYQPGDDVRSIDWNVTARMGSPFVKQYIEERELTVVLAVDVSASQEFGTEQRNKAELAAELGAILAFAAVENHDRVGLVTFAREVETFIPPAKGSRHALRLVRDLLLARSAGTGTNVAAAAAYILRTVRRRAIVFLISDFLDRDYAGPLRQAARRHDVIALSLSDPAELVLPQDGLIAAEDAETGEQIWVDATDPGTRARYESLCEDARQRRLRSLAAAGVDIVEISTRGDYLKPLLSYLEARSRRR